MKRCRVYFKFTSIIAFITGREVRDYMDQWKTSREVGDEVRYEGFATHGERG